MAEDTSTGGGPGSSLTKKTFGLPTWGWVALATAGGIVALVWFQGRKKPTTPDPNAPTNAVAYDNQGIATDQYEALLAQLRDIQGQESQDGGSGTGTTTPPPTSPPGAVKGLRAITWGSTYATFGWIPTVGATSYVISQPSGQTREVTGTEATVGGALGGNVKFPYTFTVKAKNSAGVGPGASITVNKAGGTH